MAKRGPITHEDKLLKLWNRNKDEEKSFSEIISLAKEKLGLEKRTVINYLNALCEAEVLERRVDSERRTFYKPKNKAEVDRALLKYLVEECENEEFISMLQAFVVSTQAEYSKTKSLPEAFKKAGEQVSQLWKSFEEFDKAIETLKTQKGSVKS
jgi:predicted transcriptional regulator